MFVIVYGDQEKPALLTYPDLALNRKCNEVRCCGFVVVWVGFADVGNWVQLINSIGITHEKRICTSRVSHIIKLLNRLYLEL